MLVTIGSFTTPVPLSPVLWADRLCLARGSSLDVTAHPQGQELRETLYGLLRARTDARSVC
jgi:hypothetical protein